MCVCTRERELHVTRWEKTVSKPHVTDFLWQGSPCSSTGFLNGCLLFFIDPPFIPHVGPRPLCAGLCSALVAEWGMRTANTDTGQDRRGVLPLCPCPRWVFKPMLFWNFPVPWGPALESPGWVRRGDWASPRSQGKRGGRARPLTARWGPQEAGALTPFPGRLGRRGVCSGKLRRGEGWRFLWPAGGGAVGLGCRRARGEGGRGHRGRGRRAERGAPPPPSGRSPAARPSRLPQGWGGTGAGTRTGSCPCGPQGAPATHLPTSALRLPVPWEDHEVGFWLLTWSLFESHVPHL